MFANAADSLGISHLTIRQGLSNNSVRTIYRDRSGFMWFGTYDGLNRYDGYNFRSFRNVTSDSTSLIHNYINAIGEDLHHKLLVGTSQGISIYNSLSQKFSPGEYLPFGSTQKHRISFNINAIQSDRKGTVYIATSGGGLIIKQDGRDIARQTACIYNSAGVCLSNIQLLLVDERQRIWLIVEGGGLYQFIPETQCYLLMTNQIQDIGCMASDEAGNLWMGTYRGLLYRFDVAQNRLTQPFRETIQNKSFKAILSLSYDAVKHELWMGTQGRGVGILNTISGGIKNLRHGEGKNLLSSETVFTIFSDRQQRKWLGTYKGGIDVINDTINSFEVVTHDPLNNNSLINNFVSSFFEDSSHNIWIGTDGGLSIWNRSKNLFKNFKHQDDNPFSLSNNAVPSIRQDYLGVIWIGTFGGGINRFNASDSTFKRYPCIIPTSGAENTYVWNLLEDKQHNLWATTFANGHLYRLDRKKDRFEQFSSETENFFCLADDGDILWAGTATGLCRIDKVSRHFTHFNIGKPVRAIYKSKENGMWIGTEGMGLIFFNTTTKSVAANYTVIDGLCNNSVLNILQDVRGNLWISTFHGLSQFNPITKIFKNYYDEDGLQSNQFEFNSALKLQSGEMLFGGIQGFSLFNPVGLSVHDNFSPIALTDLSINNVNIAEGSPYITAMHADGVAAVKIPYNQASLAFNFAALEYSAPGKIKYGYYLKGWDKDWNYTSEMRAANYSRLVDGHYTLYIKATNAEGAWNPKEIRIEVVVLPPWYRSWWAYLLYTVIIAALIYLYNTYRVRKAKLEYELKLGHVQRQQEKELAQIAIHNEKELAEKKLTFFTDVSHEFRTPLTLIINPLKDFLLKDKSSDNQQLNGVYNNARRLLTLIDQLLQFRQAGEDADTLHIIRLDFCKLCREVFASFQYAAHKKGINYLFQCTSESMELYADREKMEVILYNLLSNAVKFTHDGGDISVSVIEKQETIEVKLSDNGHGIPADVGNRLFERFYRVQANGLPSRPGFGIGLYLVKYFTEKHRGEISYQSEYGMGTTFSLSFSKGRAHLAEFPVYEDTTIDKQSDLSLEINPPASSGSENKGLDEILSNQKVILIVEDNADIREYIANIFAGQFIVHQASGGNEGIKMAKKYLPDIIISDIMMDGGNGIELCSTIRTDPSLGHIPIILLTAVTDKDIRLKGTESGADDYITKPFEKELLVARVNSLLKSLNRLQQYFYNEVTLNKQDFKIPAEYKEFLDNCINIIDKHLDDEDFNIKKLSQKIGMSHSVLFRKVKSISGQSVIGFIRFIRLRRAAELMLTTSDTINQIAFEVGIKDIKYFRKQFNSLFGMNPSDYIKKFRKPFTPTLTVQNRKVDDNTD